MKQLENAVHGLGIAGPLPQHQRLCPQQQGGDEGGEGIGRVEAAGQKEVGRYAEEGTAQISQRRGGGDVRWRERRRGEEEEGCTHR